MTLQITGAAGGGSLTVGTTTVSITGEQYVTSNNKPAFHASYQLSGSVIQGNGVFNQVDANRGSCYNSTNGRFTAPVNGYYYFWANAQGQGSDQPYTTVAFAKNGTQVSVEFVDQFYGGGDHKTPGGAWYLYLASGDYVNAYYYYKTRQVQCSFCGFMVR